MSGKDMNKGIIIASIVLILMGLSIIGLTYVAQTIQNRILPTIDGKPLVPFEPFIVLGQTLIVSGLCLPIIWKLLERLQIVETY